MPSDLGGIVGILVDGEVELIVVGGLAALAHGSARLTQDADFVYRRTPENIQRLASALAPPHTIRLTVFDREVLVLTLPALIQAKRAAGRPKDIEAVAELEALLVEREGRT